ncbi:MAG: aminoglycoside phosphotransferase [Planctomycetaceae bacterium]|nr:MAG: aminoglycoside phosphotransferase [Planctomycetaceae bacterium]
MMPATSQKLVELLQRPGVLARTGGRVKLLQTHMSWILLADQHAYKIKKPVDLGFADFTSLEKRRYFCEEELRVNRRLAPDLYLAVLPITGTCQSPVVGGDGEPIEYAVYMKQFPQRELLPHVLERGELGPQHVESLARDIAEFHRVVEVDRERGRFGDPENVWRPMQANLHHFEQSLDDAALRTELQQLQRWSENEFTEKRNDFAARKRDGFIRECHGDMHLGNMFRDGNSITIFDGIEFNETFRWIDVLNEVAFLVMDLKYRGRADLAHRFLNAYLERTGDYQGLVVFPFYQVYRALVRAKVKDIRSSQAQLAARARAALQNQVRDYLDLAAKCTRAPHPRLLITHGVAGTGKTRGTDPLVDQLGVIRIRSDIERKRQFGYQHLDRTNSPVGRGIYSSEITDQTYQRLADLVSTVIQAGFSAIADGTFLLRSHRDLLRRMAQKLGVPFRILDFHAHPETIRQRIVERQRRKAGASEADLKVLARQLQTQQPLASDEQDAVISIDTECGDSHPTENCFAFDSERRQHSS